MNLTTLFDNKNIVRKVIYALLSAALGVLVVKGKLTQENADQIVNTAVEFLAAVYLGVASAKVHRGSDDKTTKQDLDEAVAQARAEEAAKRDTTIGDIVGKLDEFGKLLNQRGGAAYPNGAS